MENDNEPQTPLQAGLSAVAAMPRAELLIRPIEATGRERPRSLVMDAAYALGCVAILTVVAYMIFAS